jgi:hypothetical protein
MIEGKKLDKKNKTQNFVSTFFLKIVKLLLW